MYTFDENSRYFKVEYQTPNSSIHLIEILKTSIVIAYHAITDKDALLKKLRTLYNYKEEPIKVVVEEDLYPCINCTAKGLKTCCSTVNVLKSDEERKREQFESQLKELETKHISPFLNWEQLNKPMSVHVQNCPECYKSCFLHG